MQWYSGIVRLVAGKVEPLGRESDFPRVPPTRIGVAGQLHVPETGDRLAGMAARDGDLAFPIEDIGRGRGIEFLVAQRWRELERKLLRGHRDPPARGVGHPAVGTGPGVGRGHGDIVPVEKGH
jgi:hypothetical protein